LSPAPVLTRFDDSAAEAQARTFQLSPDEDDNDGFQVVQEEVTTVAEEVERMSRASLMRNFKIAVTVYMFAFVLAFFIPVFGNDSNAGLIMTLLWNTILLLFLWALFWVFRPMEKDNPYLFVGEDETQNVHLDTRVRLQSMPTTSILCDWVLVELRKSMRSKLVCQQPFPPWRKLLITQALLFCLAARMATHMCFPVRV
jgi:hypothetical protein